MSRTGKIVVIGAGVLLVTGALLFIFGQDAKRKKAYSTAVPPDYAQEMIRKINEGK